ncbi:MAG: hypothetical protein IKW39_05785, partial [Alphaproteobacteria bacterium]|nr:hypothetical protein [Alphaproteobacteria bacterium]
RQSLFSDKLDEIRRAITGEDIDISSLDEPIDLDDYSDDENVPFDEDFSIYGTKEQTTTSTPLPSNQAEDDEEWEWEYVEDDEQVGDITDDDEWEWEYVEETEENKK